MTQRVDVIRSLLTRELEPLHLEIVDDSARHAGHAGAQGGAGHYRVRILSEKFRGKPVLARHRLVYEALRPLIPDQIHALNIEADAPGERGADSQFVNT